MKKQPFVLACVLFLLFTWLQPGHGEIYKYFDDQQRVHFTDDPASIPEKNRPSVSTSAEVYKNFSNSGGSQRFVDNNDGTVTDTTTGLFWLKNAGTFSPQSWKSVHLQCSYMEDGKYNLSDKSQQSDWRLPTLEELKGLFIQWELPQGHPFINVRRDQKYWASELNDNYKNAGDGFPTHLLDLTTGNTDEASSSAVPYSGYIWPIKKNQR